MYCFQMTVEIGEISSSMVTVVPKNSRLYYLSTDALAILWNTIEWN